MRHIASTAPTRICDCGGWTDTWFAGHGRVFHVAVEPGARVDLALRPRRQGEPSAVVDAVDFGAPYAFTPGSGPWGAHPLIEAAVSAIGIPPEMHVTLRVHSDMPAGASVGTSASVCVAVIGAMLAAAGQAVDPARVAAEAHAVETARLGQQSGVQDQWAAALGGVNLIEIDAYPQARVRPLALPPGIADALQARLMLVGLGRSHRSTAVHEQVIREVAGIGPGHPELVELRRTAEAACDAVLAARLDRLGRAMTDATEAQRRLHPALVSDEAGRVIDVARAHGAAGWKVNGAGGEGGSLTLLCGPEPQHRTALETALASGPGPARVIPIRLASTGLTVTDVSAINRPATFMRP